MVKDPPDNDGDTGSVPTPKGPACRGATEPVLQSLGFATREATAMKSPRTTARE